MDVQSYYMASCSTLSEMLEVIASQSFSFATPGLYEISLLFYSILCRTKLIVLGRLIRYLGVKYVLVM